MLSPHLNRLIYQISSLYASGSPATISTVVKLTATTAPHQVYNVSFVVGAVGIGGDAAARRRSSAVSGRPPGIKTVTTWLALGTSMYSPV
jgi:hypothetical protein